MYATTLYDRLGVTSQAAIAILSVSLMLITGFLMTRITKRLRLPNVTAYIVAGILIGPFFFDLIPADIVSGMDFLPDIALAFIAFSTGEFFRLETIRRNGPRVLIITLSEACLATVLVFILCRFVLGLSPAFSVVLAALAAATAPASTMMTIRQTHAKGPFVDTLLQVVALDDIVGLVAYSVAIAIATAQLSGRGVDFMSTGLPFLISIGALVLGGIFGALTALFMKTRHSTDNRLIIAITMLFSFCGICALFETSPLLGCMAMGTVYINLTDDERLFHQLNYFNPPILMLFFVRSGVSFDLGALFTASGSIGGASLLVIGVGYFLMRIIGKYFGAFLGSQAVRAEKRIRNFLGLALIPQAGVAIGLAELGARTLGGETGRALQTIILASSVLYELIGPACGKASLYLSGSYENPLEGAVAREPEQGQGQVQEQEPAPSPVEVLIERINQIQRELAEESISPEERVFSEEADQHYADLGDAPAPREKKRRKKAGKDKGGKGKGKA